MKKYILDFTVVENVKLHSNYVLLKMTDESALPPMLPGQFAEIRVDGSTTTFLRRPISINYVDKEKNEVWFLIQLIGDGTRQLAKVNKGDKVNVVLPLGKGFTLPTSGVQQKSLLIGGGVGTAPLLYLGEQLIKNGHQPVFLFGTRFTAIRGLSEIRSSIYDNGRWKSWRKRICNATLYSMQRKI